jgi:hypothetical protein
MFTGTRLLLEHIGSHDGDEYIDFQHIDEGVPLRLELNRPYELVVRVSGRALNVSCDGEQVYAVEFAQSMPSGRVGLRPWRSQLKCDYFEVSGEEAASTTA